MSNAIYREVYGWHNLLAAYKKAAKGKRGKAPAAAFEFRLEDHLIELQAELINKTYQPGRYVSFYIHEPKLRLISAAPFRDRVVHHALCNIIEPVFERSFIFDSYANRLNKGTHRAIDRVQHYCRRFPYVLACDVRQFFASIDHALLLDILSKQISDTNVIWLISRILAGGEGVLGEVYDMVYFRGDDLFAINRPRGLPIGNLTSQFWANCYLSGFDHYVKRGLRCPGYVRYVDDMLFFSNNKKGLWEIKRAVIERLAGLRMKIHEKKAQVRPTHAGIPFLGFTVYPNKRRLKRRKGIAYARKLRRRLGDYEQGRIGFEKLEASISGWVNHIRYADTEGLQKAVLGTIRLPSEGETHGACDTLVHQNL